MVEFGFIITSSDPKLALKDVRARQLIRSTATRATRSSKAEKASRQHRQQSDAVREISQRGGMARFRTQQRQSRPAEEVAVTRPTSAMSPLMARINFWDPVVEPLGGSAWTLLHYYRFLFRARSWAVDGKQDWFTFVIQEPMSTHATLAFVSLNRDLEEGSLISFSTLHHRAKAMSLVRERLNSPRAFLNDSLIGAVALLAITEGLEGHFALAAAHFQAVSKLVGLRGGYQQLQSNEALSRLVAWAKLCHISTSQEHCHLPVVPAPEDLSLTVGQFSHPSIKSVIFQDSIKAALPSESFRMVKLLAAVPRQPPTEETALNKRHIMSRLIHSINQILLASLQRLRADLSSQPSALLTRLLHDAAYTYISLVLRQMPRRTVVVIERAQRLRETLESTRSYASWQSLPQAAVLLVRLWACTIYHCSLLPQDRDTLLMTEMQNLIHSLEITDVDSFENRLSHISWINGFGNEELRRLVS